MNRPHFHFTPQYNWINDPNGMVCIDGEYHLFYQHYPEDIVWGPMHWGHAVSKDLLIWEHKEIAIYPDALGYIFSGSCIYDEQNVSGLGTSENPPLLAFFTHHNPDTGVQQQSIAYSLDKEHFTKYDQNPIIPNTTKKDFRDPKVFANPVKGGFTMAVAAGLEIEFYHSSNLLTWEKTGSFMPGEHGFGGICECPDCFPLETQDGIKWVLIVSMCLTEQDVVKAMENGEYASAHKMQYYIGEFDGNVFYDTVCEKEPLLFDFGTDNYAAVTFTQCHDKILLGWGENWNYVTKTPANEYRGKMIMGRKLALKNTRFGYRLCSEPVGVEVLLDYLKTEKVSVNNVILEAEKSNPDKEGLEAYTYKNNANTENDIAIMIEKPVWYTEIPYEEEQSFVFVMKSGKTLRININKDEIRVDRRECGVYTMTQDVEFQKKNYDMVSSPRFTSEGGTMKILYDEGFFEIFADNGLATFSVMTF